MYFQVPTGGSGGAQGSPGLTPEERASNAKSNTCCCCTCGTVSKIIGATLLTFGILGLTPVLSMASGVSVTMVVFGSIFLAIGLCGCCCGACAFAALSYAQNDET